jgi:glycosyltransferase involved in cell wall biosynthesis
MKLAEPPLSDALAPPLVVLIAPNVSEQMGGEAMKALQILREIRQVLPDSLQITHDRNRAEIVRLGLDGVHFVSDSRVSLSMWRTVVLRAALGPWFSWKAVRLAEQLASTHAAAGRPVVIHQVEPNSPVMPRCLSRRFPNVLGPINGNIYYPRLFRRHESFSAGMRRRLHMPLQWLRRALPPLRRDAELVLVAGGERTRQSLMAAGLDQGTFVDTVDCGVPESLLARPRLTHQGVNLRFVHFGRLVFHKGTALAIRALANSRLPIELDVVGRGPELEPCRRLVEELGLQSRVRFLDWYERHEDLIASFGAYRGMVLPSIEDANGIVVQEAMALGLPPVCLDWGGPQLLVKDGESGFLVRPDSMEAITRGIADRLDRLAEDPALAERISVAARRQAADWRWSEVMQQWLGLYRSLTVQRVGRVPNAV